MALSDNSIALYARMQRTRFLVVDDLEAMRKVTINQLTSLGAEHIFEAANGAAALKILRSQPIDMVLADWNMPVMSGLELLLSVRADPKLCALPFMMITAESERDRVILAIQSGVSELLVKPYTANRLAERVAKALSWKPRLSRPPSLEITTAAEQPPPHSPADESAAPFQPWAPAPKALEKPTILVVDDTPDNLHLLASIFKEEYRVKIAHNGEKALKIAQSDQPPDLILLDIMMPGMDGFKVAQELRSHPSSEHIPVIFVTAMTGEDARFQGMELGAIDFITKPINPEALKIRVRNFMRYVELHQQLQADYDNMLAMERLKEDIERITRHDIKGPLAGVIGLVQGFYGASNLSAVQKEQIHLIEATTLQVLDLVNLSNELYKIETGRFVLNPQHMPIVSIIRRVVEPMRRAFADKDLKINVITPPGTPDDELQAVGDPMLCYSVFQNLLKNACEAAPEWGEVKIALHAGEMLEITLDNTGVVPVPMRDCFFEKFATCGKPDGTGLGTYSAKRLTEAQGASIDMETSDEKNRTRIVLRFPMP